jgi:hypothetical protein
MCCAVEIGLSNCCRHRPSGMWYSGRAAV